VLALLLLGLAGVAAWALTRPGQVVVPTVLGETEERATQILEEAGFEVEITEVENPQPPGTVLEQDPRAGIEGDEGSTVTLTVSEGPGTARVPRVVGLTERAAARKLEDRGFQVETETRFSNEVEAGLVIGTEPEAGTKIEGGSTVTLIVSEGSNLVEVPSVVGQQQQIAENAIEQAGLIVNVDSEDSDEPEGTVIAQDPAGGSSAEQGSVVIIVVSTGAGSVVVPDVEGLFRDGAVRILRNRGLDVSVDEETVSDPAEDGRVVDQAPEGGTRVRQGDTVTILVGVLAEPSPPPPPG
jgi:serine/threonine-protein kinase